MGYATFQNAHYFETLALLAPRHELYSQDVGPPRDGCYLLHPKAGSRDWTVECMPLAQTWGGVSEVDSGAESADDEEHRTASTQAFSVMHAETRAALDEISVPLADLMFDHDEDIDLEPNEGAWLTVRTDRTIKKELGTSLCTTTAQSRCEKRRHKRMSRDRIGKRLRKRMHDFRH